MIAAYKYYFNKDIKISQRLIMIFNKWVSMRLSALDNELRD